jgi:hypothetical protein
MQLIDFNTNPVLLLYLTSVHFRNTASYFRPSPLLSSTVCPQPSLTKSLVPVYGRILKRGTKKTNIPAHVPFISSTHAQYSRHLNARHGNISPTSSPLQPSTSIAFFHLKAYCTTPSRHPLQIPPPKAWSSIMGAYIHNKSWGGLKSRQSA